MFFPAAGESGCVEAQALFRVPGFPPPARVFE